MNRICLKSIRAVFVVFLLGVDQSSQVSQLSKEKVKSTVIKHGTLVKRICRHRLSWPSRPPSTVFYRFC